jgi:subtilisin
MKRTPLLFLLCLTPLFFSLFHSHASRAKNEYSTEAVRLISEATGWESNIEPAMPIATNSAGPGRVQGTDERFARLIIKAKSEGRVRVIVGLNTPFRPEGFLRNAQLVQSQRREITQAQDRLIVQLTGSNARSLTRFAFIPFIAIEVDEAALTSLRNSPEVSSIEEDLPRPLALAESVPLIGGTAAWASGFSGAGQTVAILDSGVDKTHSFMSGKVVSEACYSISNGSYTSVCPGGVTESTSPGSGVNCSVSMNSDCAHGTHVAGIAAGKGSSFSGVARDANIISIQVFSQPVAGGRLGAFDSSIISGLQRVQELNASFNIPAVNLSIAGGPNITNCDSASPSLKAAIDNLRSIGIATVIASGNNGSTNGISYPACISSAISVGSTDDGSFGTTINTVSSFSNSASFLTLLAPGKFIDSSVPGGVFQNFSGTSMAAPHVAGAWAVLRSKAPSATLDQVLQALTSTGLPVTDSRNGITKPRITVDAALNALELPPPTQTLTVESTNPASGVNITVSPADNSGLGNGTTQFSRTYNNNTTVSLTAPATAGGNNFQKWQRNGVDWAVSQATNVTLDANYTRTAVYVAPQRTLTMASTNPSSGVNVTVSPADNSGLGNGTTQFTRTYNNNATVSLTAPATAGGNNFQKWQRNGVDWAVSQATNVTLDANYTMTAVYVAPQRTLTVASTNPASGVNIAVSPADNSGLGNGTTQFSRTYNQNTTVSLTAPATAGGNNFQKWQRNGVDWSVSRATNVTLDANYTMTAVFVDPTSALNVQWKNVVNLTASGNSLTKPTNGNVAWDAGAVSTQAIASGDGYVELTASENNTNRMCGLSNSDTNQDYADIDFAIYLYSDGNTYVFEGGINKANLGSYALNDVFRVAVEGGVVKYRKNGVVLYTSTATPTYPLLVDTAISIPGGTINNVKLSGTLIDNVQWTNAVNVTISGNNITKQSGGAAVWNAGAVSSQTITAGDGYVEFTVLETNKNRMCGLSNGDSNQDYTDIDFAWYAYDDATLYVFEGGVNRGSFGRFTTGDRLRVAVEGGVVKYRKNGALLYTSATTPIYPLLVDTAFSAIGATVSNAVISDGSIGSSSISGTPAKINWLATGHLGTPRIVDQTGTLANVKGHHYMPFVEEFFAAVGGRTTSQVRARLRESG